MFRKKNISDGAGIQVGDCNRRTAYLPGPRIELCPMVELPSSVSSSVDVAMDDVHLPSDDEWYLLAYLYGGVSSAGEHLKSTRLNGTNSSLFNVQRPSIFWSSSELDADAALDWKVNFRWVKLQRWKGGKKAYNSVRCVKDY